MRIVIDLEANGLHNPTKIWLVVSKDIDTGEIRIFRNITENVDEQKRCIEHLEEADLIIGHNILGYDLPVLTSLVKLPSEDLIPSACDTLILSKLIDYSRKAHSIEQYGEEFGYSKIKFNDWTKWSEEMEEYCVRDVEICERIFHRFSRPWNDPAWRSAIETEHKFQLVVNLLHDTGFAFDVPRAEKLLQQVNQELEKLDKDILSAFPPKTKLIREIHPKLTKHGTLNKSDFRFVKDGDLSEYNGGPFSRLAWVNFNPSSHKQIIEVLNKSGWSPVDKTQTHIETEREYKRLIRSRDKVDEVALKSLYDKLLILGKYGWKVNENNLGTLPDSAPAPARLLAKRILYESRRRTLTEWLELVNPETKRIHGQFYGIGAWTHRMAHQRPNTANIPSVYKEDGSVKLLGGEMRSLWRAPKNRLLVGVDAEGIQLRIFAHYINDPEFTNSLVRGKKEDKTDPHSLNQRILGDLCKTRQAAKRFIYALLLGAGLGKLAQILECSDSEAREALDRLLVRYTGFAELKQNSIPKDARRGYFIGLDGRKVAIPGDTVGERKHLTMSGYLQNGEAIVVKRSVLRSLAEIDRLELPAKLVNIVHDEVVFEVKNDIMLAEQVKEIFCDSIVKVGEELNLNCPLAGDGHIGLNWKEIH